MKYESIVKNWSLDTEDKAACYKQLEKFLKLFVHNTFRSDGLSISINLTGALFEKQGRLSLNQVPVKDVRYAVNAVDAVDYLYETLQESVTYSSAIFKRLNKILMHGISDYAGQYRHSATTPCGNTYDVAPDEVEVQFVYQLNKLYEKTPDRIAVITDVVRNIRNMVPFEDGTNITSRFIYNYLLVVYGIPPIANLNDVLKYTMTLDKAVYGAKMRIVEEWESVCETAKTAE